MVSDKTIHKAFRIHKLYKQNPLEICFVLIFTMYQNYTMALNKHLLLFYTHCANQQTKHAIIMC